MKVWIVWEYTGGTKELWNIYLNETEASQDAAVQNECSHIGVFDLPPFVVEEWPIAGTV